MDCWSQISKQNHSANTQIWLCNDFAVTSSNPNGRVHETKPQRRGEKKGSHVSQHLHITSQNDPDSQGI